MPSACANFGHQLPAVGTKVTFRTVIDAKTDKIRAEAVGLQDNAQQSHPEATTTQRKDKWPHFQSGFGARPIGANPLDYKIETGCWPRNC